MTTFWGLQWSEWFVLAIGVFTLGAPFFFLIYFFRRHYMDNLDCSKYEVFTTDPALRADEQPHAPLGCEPQYLKSRSWWGGVNQGWFWLTLGVAVVWLLIMVFAFAASRGIPELRQSLPM